MCCKVLGAAPQHAPATCPPFTRDDLRASSTAPSLVPRRLSALRLLATMMFVTPVTMARERLAVDPPLPPQATDSYS